MRCKNGFYKNLITGGLFALFLFFVVYVFSQSTGDNFYPDPRNYVPNFWFDSQEEYYPANPLSFYYDKNLNELSGEVAVKTYRAFSLQDKLNNFVVFYDVKDLGGELVYQYWIFYVFNKATNEHYGDWEFIQVFVNKDNKEVNKIIGSQHIGTTTKIAFANAELIRPNSLHTNVLVEKGAHANWIDGNNNGSVEWKQDITNWYNAYKIRGWSKEDQKNGVKVFYDSPYYKLRPLSELEEKIGDKDLISKEKSPTLGMVPLHTPFGITIPLIGITSDVFYALKLGGEPPQNAWLKPEYADPNKASPITFADAVNFVQSKAAIAFSAVKNLATSAYQQIVGSIGKMAQGFFATVSSAFSQITGQNSSPQQEDKNIVSQNPQEAAAASSPFYDATFLGKSPDIETEAGGEAILWAEFRNTGTASWEKQSVSLNITSNPPSPFYHSSWLTQKRPVRLDQTRVDPGGVGRFSFSIRIPDLKPGNYAFRLRPVYQDSTGFHWLGDDSVSWAIEFEEEGVGPSSAVIEGDQPEISEEIHDGDGGAGEIIKRVYEPGEEKPVDEVGDNVETEDQDQKNQEQEEQNQYDFPRYNFGGGSVPPTPDYGSGDDQDGGDESPQDNPEDIPEEDTQEETQPTIYINEVQVAKDEFIELFNPGEESVDMAGWVIAYFSSDREWNNPHRKKIFPEDSVIPAGGHYLIGLSGFPETGGNPNSDWQIYSLTGQLSDSKGSVGLFPWSPDTEGKSAEEASTGRIDAVGWGEVLVREDTATEVPGENQSIERNDSLVDTDHNFNDFHIQESPTPTNSSGETVEEPDKKDEEIKGPEEDTAPPDTILDLDLTPEPLTNLAEANFEFYSTEPGSIFECLLDGGEEPEWTPCESPHEFQALEDGEHLFRVRARDEAGNVDPTPVEFSWVIDTTAPTAFLRLGDDYSPINTDFTIVWGLENFEEEPSLDYFELEFSQDGGITWNGVELSEDETQNRERIFTVPDEERTYYIRIRTNDMLGNTSDWRELAVDINTRAVVINEIGYRGTNASFYDEWIELLNVSNHDISLEGWRLDIGKDMLHKIKLEGMIPAHGFYLLERDIERRESDQAISDIEADLLYQGAVNDGRVFMWLIEPEGRVIDYVDKIWTSTPEERISMERVSPYVAGNDPHNWLWNNGETIKGEDADGNPVLGTPKAENSVYLLYHSLFLVPSIFEDTTFFEERGPYVVYNTLTVEEGVTLTVEPGVIFHFADAVSKLIVDGTLLSQGTADKEVVYTSIRDSEYGGSGSAAPGAWKWMVFTPKSRGSVFEYSRIRYPGYFTLGYRSDNGGIIVSGTDLVFRNSVFERALIKGLHVISSRVTIEGSRFLDTKSAFDSAGLIIDGESEVSISDSEFRGNSYGMYIRSAKVVEISDSQFTDNDNPLYAVNISPIFAGEMVFSGNNYDGVTISGVLEGDSRWYAGITYVVYQSIEVAEGATLTIEPGTIVKFREDSSALTVYGDILALGEEGQPIIFTSLRDDTYGGDTENDGATNGVPGSWRWILVAGTGEEAIFEHVIIRYAGKYYTGFRGNNAGLWVGGRDAEIRNMVLEHTLIYGLRLSGCDCIVEDSVFRYHNKANDSTAIIIDGGAPTLKNLNITNNSFGIWLKSGFPTFENIYFEGNTKDTTPEGIIP